MIDRFSKHLHFGAALLTAVGEEMKTGVAVFMSPIIAVGKTVARAAGPTRRQDVMVAADVVARRAEK
jgi:hypothetical protein